MKLDHHCPWINCCVGHHNHAYFVSFLISAVIGCSHATVVLVCSLYRAMYRVSTSLYKVNSFSYFHIVILLILFFIVVLRLLWNKCSCRVFGPAWFCLVLI